VNICLVSAWRLVEPLQKLGHTVLLLTPRPEDGPILDLPRALDEAGFAPDLLVQQENLLGRVLLMGLEDVPCIRVFWSLDTHLNAWWTTDYGKLFDGVLTTQPDWVSRLRAGGLHTLGVLSWFGTGMDFTPHARRGHDVAFVGRLPQDRPVRAWHTEFLRARWNAAIRSDLAPQDVLPFYGDARIAPNESSLGETKIRLFETASAGCCVLAQDSGPAQELFFEPGREMAVYNDGLELSGLIERFLAVPAEAERLGRAARARVLAEHLPAHRAASLLSFASSLSRAGATGGDARRHLWSTLARMSLGGLASVPQDICESRLLPHSANPEAAALQVRLLAARGAEAEVKALAAEALGGRIHEQSLDYNLAVSMAALRQGDLEAARLFLLRWSAAAPVAKAPAPPAAAPASPVRLLLSWARRLQSLGRLCSPGLAFDPDRSLPASAADCLLWAARAEPDNSEVLGLLDLWLEEQPGWEASRLDFIARLSAQDPDEWRHPLRHGLLSLRCFRLPEGLQQLTRARDMAENEGRGRIFRAALAAGGGSSRILNALDSST